MGAVPSAIVVSEEGICLSEENHFVALDRRSLKPIWTARIGGRDDLLGPVEANSNVPNERGQLSSQERRDVLPQVAADRRSRGAHWM